MELRIFVAHVRELFARHHDERRAIAPDAVADGSHPVGHLERRRQAAAPAREVRARDDADWSHVCVDATAHVAAMAERAGANGTDQMFSALDRCVSRRKRERARRHVITRVELPLAQGIQRCKTATATVATTAKASRFRIRAIRMPGGGYLSTLPAYVSLPETRVHQARRRCSDATRSMTLRISARTTKTMSIVTTSGPTLDGGRR